MAEHLCIKQAVLGSIPGDSQTFCIIFNKACDRARIHLIINVLFQTLEVECIGVEPKLHELQAKYELLNDLGQSEEDEESSLWEGEDEALQDKDKTEHRYKDLLDKLQQQKEVLRDELTK